MTEMAKEFVLVPKLKYESMVKASEQPIEPEPQKPHETIQEGGQSTDSHPNVESRETLEVPRSPPKLYVKRPLTEMDFYKDVNHRQKRSRNSNTPKVKWINYNI